MSNKLEYIILIACVGHHNQKPPPSFCSRLRALGLQAALGIDAGAEPMKSEAKDLKARDMKETRSRKKMVNGIREHAEFKSKLVARNSN